MRRPDMVWLIPALIGLLVLLTLPQWLPDPLADYHAEQARLMAVENDEVCAKFMTDREQLAACSVSIGHLRQRDRDTGGFF